MDAESSLVRFLYMLGAALAGAISALPSMRWKEMQLGERFLTVFVGASCAMFLTPLIAIRLGITDLQTVCALTYGMGLCGNAIVPMLIEKGRETARVWGEKRAIKQEEKL